MRKTIGIIAVAISLLNAGTALAKELILSCTYDDYIIVSSFTKETTYHKYIKNTEQILSIDFKNKKITEINKSGHFIITDYNDYTIHFIESENQENHYYINRTNGIYNIEVYEEDELKMYSKGKCEKAKQLF